MLRTPHSTAAARPNRGVKELFFHFPFRSFNFDKSNSLAMNSRYLLLIVLFLGSASAWAQETAIHYFQADQPMDVIAQRSIHETILDLDPNAVILHHFDDQSLVQINVNPSVSELELRNAIAAQGISLLAGTPVIPVQEPVTTTPQGRPLYVVTGNEAADRANYQAAVEVWNTNNPSDRIEMPLSVGDQ